ncbi:hypothetical protein [Halobaculum lipolyticum]|uniref:Oligopeptide transporter, OPT family n=1 Tax=Halobaculum lipolyticum TaxID=3032001 RepID=A0ABD5WB76_9EURY|nr:hypothetical protein [Halobaculum sp. DT31]
MSAPAVDSTADGDDSSVDSSKHGSDQTATVDSSNWDPPYAGSTIAVLVTIGASVALAVSLGVIAATAIAAVGAVGVGLVLWVADSEQHRYLRSALGVLIGVPTGAAALTGVVYVVLQQFAGSAPVGSAAVVIGVAIAALGATVLPGDSLTLESLDRAGARTFVGAGVVTIVAAVDIGRSIVAAEELEVPGVPTIELGLLDPLLGPTAGPVPPIGTLLLIVGVASVGAWIALGKLPIREVLDDRSDDPGAALERYERIQRLLSRGWIAAAVGIPVVLVNQLSQAPVLWRRLPPVLFSIVDALARSSMLRSLAVVVFVASVATVCTTWLLKRAARIDPSAHAGSLGAFAGGGLAVIVATATAEPVITTLLTEVETVLPAETAAEFGRQSSAVVSYYGEPSMALGLAAVGAVSTLTVCLFLRIAMTASVLSPAGNGHALAAAGLLGAGAFSLTVDVSATVGIGSIIAAVVVADTGRFGRSIGRDVGRRAHSMTAQVVHTGGVLGVSVLAGVAAIGALTAAGAVSVPVGAPATLALLAGVGSVSVLALTLALSR